MKVFISSTYIDLKNYRQIAIKIVSKLDYVPLAMENFGARAQEPVKVCSDYVKECDIFVGIYAHRYGFIPQGSKKSITQQEYELAKKIGKPCLCFIVKEDFPWKPGFVDKENYEKLETFLAEVKKKDTVGFFGDIEDFQLNFSTSLHKQLREMKSIKKENEYDVNDRKELNVKGCEYLFRSIDLDNPRFKDYLYSDKSPFISRTDFIKQYPEFSDLKTESYIYDQLIKSDRYDGCVIFGEGGIGKTRLMLELGFLAEKDEWIVYSITPQMKDISLLKPFLYSDCKHLLLFDYIEESNIFTAEILIDLKKIAPNSTIKVIANCRNTYRHSFNFPESDDFFDVDLMLKNNRSEMMYKDYVIQKIIGDLSDNFEHQKSFFELRPAFAVFIRFIYEKYKDKIPDLDVKGLKRFREWLKRRLGLTFKKDVEMLFEDQTIFNLFSILPAQSPISEQLIKKYKKYVSPLLADGWWDFDQDKTGDNLWVIHDSIADEMLYICLFQQQTDLLQIKICEIFDFAIANSCFKSCFRAFERISDRDVLKNRNNDMYKTLSTLLKKGNIFEGFENRIFETTLLEDQTIVRLVKENLNCFKTYLESFRFGLQISFLMYRFSKIGANDETKENLKQPLNIWIGSNLDFFINQSVTARIISTFILFYGINEGFGHKNEKIEKYVTKYLNKFLINLEVTFVIKAWLNKGGDKEIVKPFLIKWLEIFNHKKEAGFLIVAWLEAGGEKEIIRSFMIKWIKRFLRQIEANFVIVAWLDAGGDKEIIRPFMIKWIDKFLYQIEANFVIVAWLRAGGDKEIIKPFLVKWIENFPQQKETNFVIVAWLKAGGDKKIVEPFIPKWLDTYIEEMEASFVIKTWLKQGGNRNLVKTYIKNWLSNFPLDEENTSFVITAWLEAKGEPEEVASFVKKWLKKYCNSFEASFVIEAWLNAKQNHEFIKEYAYKWLKIHRDHKQADFVIKRFCKFKDIPEDTLEDAIYWCRKYASDFEVIFKLGSLSEVHIFNEKFADKWLLDILQKWISTKSLKEKKIISNIERILCNVSENKNFLKTAKCQEIFKLWFLSNYSFQDFILNLEYFNPQQKSYFEAYVGLLEEGKIDSIEEEDKIKKFLNWVNNWFHQNKIPLKQMIKNLKDRLPEFSHLWDIVQFD